MKTYYLIVDGMLSGTGVRDAVNGGYLNLNELGIGHQLEERIAQWLLEYAEAHFEDFANQQQVTKLDEQGVEICKALRKELPSSKIQYFSSARMQNIES